MRTGKEVECKVQKASILLFVNLKAKVLAVSFLNKQFIFPAALWDYQDLSTLYLSSLLQQATMSHIYKDKATEMHRY